MKLVDNNVVRFAFGVFIIAILAGGATWLVFGFTVSVRYLYLSIGIGVALISIFQMVRRLTQHDGTVQAQLINTIVRQQGFSSISNILRVLLLVTKDTALRLTYWPLEFGLMAIEDRAQRAPNLIARSAIVTQFMPRYPVLVSGAMLAVNLTLLCLHALFQLPAGGSFQVIVTICMYVTIIWFLDLLVNPIENQLRVVGTVSEATIRFVLVSALSLLAVIVLVYTYRLLTASAASVAVVVGDVLFAGRFNADLKVTETAIFEALSKGAIAAAWDVLSNMDQGLLISLAACFLFYSTVGKRLWPILKGKDSSFRRTEAENVWAVVSSLQLGDFDQARRYASELAPDHELLITIDLREAFAHGQFDDAYGMTQQWVDCVHRRIKSKGVVKLESRERWFVLTILTRDIGDSMIHLRFAIWSIEQPYFEERDLAKLIIICQLYGGVPQVLAFAHYLHACLEGKGERAARFRENVVAHFMIGSWQKSMGRTVRDNSFETAYSDLLSFTFQTQKALYLLEDAPLFMNAPGDLSERAFGNYVAPPTFADWTDVTPFENLKDVDRAYVVDTMVSFVGAYAQSSDKEGRLLAEQVNKTQVKLEELWGGPVFDRLGIGSKVLSQFGSALGIILK